MTPVKKGLWCFFDDFYRLVPLYPDHAFNIFCKSRLHYDP